MLQRSKWVWSGGTKILGECQGAAVSSAPRVELTSAAPNASLYAPGAPVLDMLDAPGHASTHASGWARPIKPGGDRAEPSGLSLLAPAMYSPGFSAP